MNTAENNCKNQKNFIVEKDVNIQSENYSSKYVTEEKK